MGTVYLLGEFCDTGRFKIGVTKGDIDKRIKTLQTGNSNEIFLVDKYESDNYQRIEAMLHRRYHMKRGIGEWFELTSEQIVSFRGEAKQADEIITIMKRDNPFYK